MFTVKARESEVAPSALMKLEDKSKSNQRRVYSEGLGKGVNSEGQ